MGNSKLKAALGKIKWRLKYARWFVVTILLLPIAIPIFLLADLLIWLGENASAFSERFSRLKHEVAPYPLRDEVEYSEDEDL